MKQLPLFRPTIDESIKLTDKKRLKRKHKSVLPSDPNWNLWKQEKEEGKEMALFFLDIRNFTPFVEQHSATEVIYVVRKLFSEFHNIIRVNHGQIIETSGDGFYAAFGFNESIDEAVISAVKTGHLILEALESLNERFFIEKLQQRIEVGIGLHAGVVASGSIHLGGKDHKIVMGYPVNIAARLEAATKELNNSFIISDVVYELLNTKPIRQSEANIQLKGVNGSCKIHLIGRPYGCN